MNKGNLSVKNIILLASLSLVSTLSFAKGTTGFQSGGGNGGYGNYCTASSALKQSNCQSACYPKSCKSYSISHDCTTQNVTCR